MIEFGNENMDIKNAPFLLNVNEDEDNNVRFTISLTCEEEIHAEINDVEQNSIYNILKNKNLIRKDEKEIYEISFERYILYQIRNESFCSWDDYELRQGKFFIIFEKSRLLDTLPLITDCQIGDDGEAYPGKWKHYGIYCQNHIIDIISHNEPIIKKLDIA